MSMSSNLFKFLEKTSECSKAGDMAEASQNRAGEENSPPQEVPKTSWSNSTFKLCDLVNYLQKFTDFYRMHIGAEGVVFSVVDPTHVCTIRVVMASEDFKNGCGTLDGRDLAIDMARLHRKVKRFNNKGDSTTFQYGRADSCLALSCRGINFQLKHMQEAEPDEIPTPNIAFACNFPCETKAVVELLEFAANVGTDYVRFRFDPVTAQLTLSGEEEDGTAFYRCVGGSGDPEGVASEAIYHVDWLLTVFKISISEVRFEFASEMPLHVEFSFGRASKIHAYLAPRVEEEDGDGEADLADCASDFDSLESSETDKVEDSSPDEDVV